MYVQKWLMGMIVVSEMVAINFFFNYFVCFIDLDIRLKNARKEDILQKAATIAQQHHTAVHPIVFRGPHPIRDESSCILTSGNFVFLLIIIDCCTI